MEQPSSLDSQSMSRLYSDALRALQERGRFGIRLGLGRTQSLLRALGSPEVPLRGALIGGTNGKGSVQAMVSSVLREGGFRVGQTPKPHLVSYRERIVVDGRPIAPEDFAALVAEVLGVADGLAPRLGPPTEFEALTAAALLWFARCAVDVAVVEVGLGGRLDATNAWDGGVAAITNVDRDHMELLGDTITAIAREKAAIIKRGDRAVTGASGDALGVVRRRASRLGVPLDVVTPLEVERMDREGTWVGHPDLGPMRLGLLGRHQAANAAVALGVIDALGHAGIAPVDPRHLKAGLAAARWPGRLELLSLHADGRAGPSSTAGPVPTAPDVLLDGAHNRAGAGALAAAMGELRPTLSPGRVTLLLGILRDKEVTPMIEAIAADPSLQAASLVATRAPFPGRALTAAELAAAWRHVVPGARPEALDDLDDALARAVELARASDGPLVVAGSLYLVGAVRGRLVDDPDLLDPVS
jgi:dihydrofolate synthase/folylpolyglutamate synthase